MKSEVLGKLIESVVGKQGVLRAPAWWMRRILQGMLSRLDAADSRIAAIDGTVNEISEKVQEIDTLDSRVSALGDTVDSCRPYVIVTPRLMNTDASSGRPVYADIRFYIDGELVVSSNGYNYQEKKFYFEKRFSPNPDTGQTGNSFIATVDMTHAFFRYPNFMEGFKFTACSSLTAIEGLENVPVRELRSLASFFSQVSLGDWGGIKDWDVSNITNMDSMFVMGGGGGGTLDLSSWRPDKVTSIAQMFMGASFVTINVGGWNTSKVTDMQYLFMNSSLRTLNISNWDFGNADTSKDLFNCSFLTDVTGPVYNIRNSISLRNSRNLTAESAMVFINGLAEVGEPQTLTLSSEAYGKLTEEQIAIATSKGWTIVSA